MLRRTAAAVLALLALAPATALAHEGNPNFSSEVDGSTPGLGAEVVNYDDSIVLEVEPGHEVIVLGYEEEPYLRFSSDGTVEVNRSSPAAYLNDDRFAEVEVPEQADPEAKPSWEGISDDGRHTWHDHRIHWMAKSTPPQVEDESVRTEIFDWRLPVVVDGDREAIEGSLTWVGDGGDAPVALGIALGAVAVLSIGFTFWRIRRRGASADSDSGGQEAW